MKRTRDNVDLCQYKSSISPDASTSSAKSARVGSDHLDSSTKDADNQPCTDLDLTLSSDVEMQRISSAIDTDDHKLILRGYQLELAEKALSGLNALIVAPTGSGKTAVLTEIIKQHVESEDKGQKRVLFFVPKTTLAQQQFKFLARHLSCAVSYIIGEHTSLSPPGLKIKNSEVTILTPQVFINELKRPADKRYIGFEDISMLIFDECHNATKKHPYKEIMDMLLDMKSNQHQIQVVGVTASPGVGRAKEKQKVKENLLHLLANLNISTAPCIVEKNLEELNKHQNEIRESLIHVKTETEFENKIMKVMDEIECDVKKLNTENEATQLNSIPSEKAKQVYVNWTNQLKKHGRCYMSDQESARKLITYSRHLQMYHSLLNLKNLIPQAMEHTNKMVDFVKNGSVNIELEKKNQELLKVSSDIELPMLEKLNQILLKEFTENPDARCIIFVQMRLTAKCLEECIANNESLKHLNPKYMTGTHAGENNKAMTRVDQDVVLKLFRDGDSKILIATSVAEEGLDIPACNLVIMYNYVTGEVGRIQRKGRGRALDSRAIVITAQDSDHSRKEEDNKICSQASDIAIEDVKNTSESDLKKQILEIQKKQKEERDREKEAAMKSRKNDELPSRWQVLCCDCGKFITSGEKLRHIDNTHTVVMDEGFHKRMTKQKMKQNKGPHIQSKANFICSNSKCGQKIALELVHKKALFPTLSIKKIKLKRDDGRIEIPGKKSNMPFRINKSVYDGISEDLSEISDDEYEDDVPMEDTLLDDEISEFLSL